MAITAPAPASVPAPAPRPGTGPLVPEWGATSHVIDLGSEIHFADFGGPDDGDLPPIVLVHGLGGSYANWGMIAPLLAKHSRVYALDLIGFGLSNPAGRSATVSANSRLVTDFIDTVADGRAVLVGNSMGGLISMMVASAYPEKVAGLALLDPVLPRVRTGPHDPRVIMGFSAFLVPGLGTRFLRSRRTMPPRDVVMEALRLCSPHPGRIPEAEVQVAVEITERRNVQEGLEKAYLEAVRSLLGKMVRYGQFHAMLRSLRMPVTLLCGEADRLVPIGSSRAVARRCPEWQFESFPDVGHIPMMEIPEVIADRIGVLLSGIR